MSGLTVVRNQADSITLSWEPSCSNSDTDYEVYEGEIGFWYSHAAPASGPVCSTNGAVTITFDAGPGNRFRKTPPPASR